MLTGKSMVNQNATFFVSINLKNSVNSTRPSNSTSNPKR